MITKTDCCVVGAGAAGLTCALHLQKAGLKVKVLEAGNQIGGRIRQDDSIADFPIDVGAEWIHGKVDKILNPIVDCDVASGVKTLQDNSGRRENMLSTSFFNSILGTQMMSCLPIREPRKWSVVADLDRLDVQRVLLAEMLVH